MKSNLIALQQCRLITILPACLFWMVLMAKVFGADSFTNGRPFFISFDYMNVNVPSNITFRAHASQDFNTPVDTWPIITTNFAEVVTTNSYRTLESAESIPAFLPIQFFVISASNEWGVVFSEVLATAPPRVDSRLRLR